MTEMACNATPRLCSKMQFCDPRGLTDTKQILALLHRNEREKFVFEMRTVTPEVQEK